MRVRVFKCKIPNVSRERYTIFSRVLSRIGVNRMEEDVAKEKMYNTAAE